MHARAAAIVLLASAAVLPSCQEREKGIDSYRLMGDSRMSTGQYDQAAANYQEFVDRKPGDPYMRAALGKAYLKSGKPDLAAENLRVAYSQRPQDVGVLDDLAESLVQSKQYDEAFRLLRTNAADRGTIDDHMRLGKYALRMGDSDTARVALLTAARLDKGRNAAPQLALCDFYSDVKDTSAAMKRLRMAYWIAPQQTEVLERCRKLNAITGPTFGVQPEEYVAPPVKPESYTPGGGRGE